MSNRLASEHSPYLRQHRDNPVDWFPWGPEAFARARADDRPIFLSIGYSTCHWCHVMAHESFESPEVAAALNAHFVSIKVDREERPDIDRVYMMFVQATTGAGGWPMSVWLTPALKPFYGGTYFPPTSRWGRPGFVDILTELARVWRDDRAKAEQAAASIVERLEAYGREPGGTAVPDVSALGRAVDSFSAVFDRRHGGFGTAPKFPRPSELSFLLQEHARTGQPESLQMATATLGAIASGGVRDHLGGGFHRYSVDAEWRVPHFEKMLYDQAQLVSAFVEAWQATGDGHWAEVAADALRYVRERLTGEAGELFSAEDADSVPPGAEGAVGQATEGAFYLWRRDEVAEVLGAATVPFCLRYGVRIEGNLPAESEGELEGQNVLSVAMSIPEVAEASGLTHAEGIAVLAAAREQLRLVRESRPRPMRDDKVLTGWNGLMIGAFARAGRVLAQPGYVEAAEAAAAFVRTHLVDAHTGRLLRRFRAGHAAVPAFAEDYAFLAHGLVELFQATGQPDWLTWALALHEEMDRLFADEDGGGWFSTEAGDESVLIRVKEQHDGAEPSATSVGAWTRLLVAQLTGDASTHERAQRAIASFHSHIGRAVPMMLTALSTYHAGVTQIVVVGDARAADTMALMDVVRRAHVPAAVVVPVVPGCQPGLLSVLPWLEPMVAGVNRATAFVCRNFVCELPTTSPERLASLLAERKGRAG